MSAQILSIFIKEHERTPPDRELTYYERISVSSATVGKQGIQGSFDWNQMEANLTDPDERAVLVQTKGNIAKLSALYPADTALLTPGGSAFGENLVIDNFDSSDVCIGDVIHVFSGQDKATTRPSVIFEISSSCAPCAKFGAVHRVEGLTPSQGVKGYSAEHALRGYFYRVLQEGELRVGDTLVLVHRPYPQWNLERVAQLCYGGPNKHGVISTFLGSEVEMKNKLE